MRPSHGIDIAVAACCSCYCFSEALVWIASMLTSLKNSLSSYFSVNKPPRPPKRPSSSHSGSIFASIPFQALLLNFKKTTVKVPNEPPVSKFSRLNHVPRAAVDSSFHAASFRRAPVARRNVILRQGKNKKKFTRLY